jgi:hypothetical protein
MLALLCLISLDILHTNAQPMKLVGMHEIAGSSVDRTKLATKGGANVNRFGFFSDLFYDHHSGDWFALADRGAAAGLAKYETRVQRLAIHFHHDGSIDTAKILETIRFKRADGTPFDGENPLLLNGNVGVLGQSFDPEGFVVGRDGSFFVADEYGPSVYEFDKHGVFVRAFATPANVLPKAAGGVLDFFNDRPTLKSGRQSGRGFEGLAINPSGSKLYAILQEPLAEEGSGDGRFSRNLRIVEYDIALGTSTKQFIYVTDSIDDINLAAPTPADKFAANAQGRLFFLKKYVYSISRIQRVTQVEILAAVPLLQSTTKSFWLSNATIVASAPPRVR